MKPGFYLLKIFAITLPLALLLLISCKDLNISRTGHLPKPMLDSLAMKWRGYYNTGDYRTVADEAEHHLRAALFSDDSLLALYSSAFASQSFLFMDEADSALYYLQIAESMGGQNIDPRTGVIINNIKGMLAIKSELDYSAALQHYRNALKWAESGNDTHNQIIILSNIVSIFYIRKDSYGLEYARSAYSIAAENGNNFGKCIAGISMAQMLSLSHDSHKAMSFISMADSIAVQDNMMSLYSMIDLIKAELCSEQSGEKGKAEFFFKKSLENGTHTDPGTLTLICLKYGNYCERMAEFEKSIGLYKKGLGLSRKFRNMEFRQELLESLSRAYGKLGDSTNRSKYGKMYKACIDSVFNMKKEHEFSSLLLSYQAEKHQKETAVAEVALLKSNRRTLIAVFCLVISAVFTSFILLQYHRQRRMYRSLVYQHQCYLKNSQPLKEPEEQEGDISDKTLFECIEKLMIEEKLFKEKSLTLDRVAELAGTNRTYVSKAINKFANMTFYGYVDNFRIRYAVEIMSKTDPVIPFKQIADETGYNSLSVFYKAFQKATGCTPGQYRNEIQRLKRNTKD